MLNSAFASLPFFRLLRRTKKVRAMAVANGFPVLSSQAYLEGKKIWETRAVMADLCRQFYSLGCVSGPGGSITIKVHDDSIPKPDQLIVMSPSGVQKERIIPEDTYVLSSGGEVLCTPCPKPSPHKSSKCSDCASLFMKAECYHYPFYAAIKLHQLGIDWTSPKNSLIKNKSYQSGSKRKFDVYTNAGLAIQDSIPSRKCIVLDIEGTTTPISFVTEILFPYARDNVRKHLTSTYDSLETKNDIKLLRAQVLDDLEKGISGSTPIPPDDARIEVVIESLVTNVEAMIKADRKITALKQLQGHIWRTGYDNNELQGVVFDDVPEALERWHASGIKIYIYSSGSREAQRLIFGNTAHGDLRKYLCGYFDTTVGYKREARSYFEIFQSVGVDNPSQILFITDIYEEAVAAKAAGLEVIISIRPGNAPPLENHDFRTITSFAEV